MWFVGENLLMVLLAAFILTQIIIPIVRGTQMFPLFRRRSRTARLAEVREKLEQVEMDREVQELLQKLVEEVRKADSTAQKEKE